MARPQSIGAADSDTSTQYPTATAGQSGMAIDLRASNVTPDQAGRITIRVRAAGDHDAILRGIEVE